MLNHEDLLNGAFGGLSSVRTFGESPRESAAAARQAGGSAKVVPISAAGVGAMPTSSTSRAVLFAWVALFVLLVFGNIVTLKVQK